MSCFTLTPSAGPNLPKSSVAEPGGEPKCHCDFPFKVNFQHRFCELDLQNELQLQEVILVQPFPSPGVSVRPISEYLCHCDTPSVLAILLFFFDYSENNNLTNGNCMTHTANS